MSKRKITLEVSSKSETLLTLNLSGEEARQIARALFAVANKRATKYSVGAWNQCIVIEEQTNG